MTEQYTTPATPYPAEGRCDIAVDLEEEQSNAYSTHRMEIFTRGKRAPVKIQQREELLIEVCHPAEGRCDIATDLEEEQSNAYSAHHTGPAA